MEFGQKDIILQNYNSEQPTNDVSTVQQLNSFEQPV